MFESPINFPTNIFQGCVALQSDMESEDKHRKHTKLRGLAVSLFILQTPKKYVQLFEFPLFLWIVYKKMLPGYVPQAIQFSQRVSPGRTRPGSGSFRILQKIENKMFYACGVTILREKTQKGILKLEI